jgi:hypothetical protein
VPDPAAARAPDLLDREFVAPAPNRTWVADFTHVAARAGVVYVAFIVDTFSRRIVGWSASLSKQTQLVLDALDMGLWRRDRDGRPPIPGELVHHSDSDRSTHRFASPNTWTRLGSRPPAGRSATRAGVIRSILKVRGLGGILQISLGSAQRSWPPGRRNGPQQLPQRTGAGRPHAKHLPVNHV